MLTTLVRAFHLWEEIDANPHIDRNEGTIQLGDMANLDRPRPGKSLAVPMSPSIPAGKWTGVPMTPTWRDRLRNWLDSRTHSAMGALVFFLAAPLLCIATYAVGSVILNGRIFSDCFFVIFLFIGLPYNIPMLILSRQRSRSIDLALLEDQDDHRVALVELAISRDRNLVGIDRGVVWEEAGAIHFCGHACSFTLQGADLSPVVTFRADPIANRIMFTTKDPVVLLSLYALPRPSDRWRRAGRKKLDNIQRCIREQHTTAEPRSLPPLTPFNPTRKLHW